MKYLITGWYTFGKSTEIEANSIDEAMQKLDDNTRWYKSSEDELHDVTISVFNEDSDEYENVEI